MSLPDTLTLKNATNDNVAFTKTSDDSTKTVYTADSSTIGLPTTFTVMHDIAKPSVSGVDRHTIKYSMLMADDNSKLYTLPCSLTFSKPRQVITDVDVENAIAAIVSFLMPANITKLIRGEN